MSSFYNREAELYIPNELMPQTTPCVKILCSYSAMRAPSVAGVKSGKMMLLLGRLPSKTLDLIRASDAFAGSSYGTSSTRKSVKLLMVRESRVTYSADLLLSLAERESLGLGKVVGEASAREADADLGVNTSGGTDLRRR